MKVRTNDKLSLKDISNINGLYAYTHPAKKIVHKPTKSIVEPETPQSSMPVRLHDIMTPNETQEYLSISYMTLKRWTKAGRISCIRINERGDRRYLRSEVMRFLEGI